MSNVRNICIVAHVDHGKSSFADSLLASNGIISSRMAGTIRYLDSREDEQQRGITMESSAICLKWRIPVSDEPGAALEEYKINIIDTPGHVDFSSEVSTASRLCDGALVLVDAVEGVCTQTITVLRQVYQTQLVPILVLNKIDRLITELRLSPNEAYHHLSRIIVDVNAIVGSFFATDRMQDDEKWHNNNTGESPEFTERDDSNLYFDPAIGNVIFSSAIDGWGFRISRFAQLYAKKLNMNQEKLNRCLWGDYYFDPKSKLVIGRKKMEASGKKLKPLFVQFVLENLWAVYQNVSLQPDQTMVEKIITSLDLKVKPQDLRSKNTRHLLTSIFSQWLPLAPSAFRAITSIISSPSASQAIRMPRILHPDLSYNTEPIPPANKLEKDLYEGNSSADRTRVAFVSKMFAVPTRELPEHQRRQLNAEEMREKAKQTRLAREQVQEAKEVKLEEREEHPRLEEDPLQELPSETLLGFARLFSGTINVSDTMYAVLPKYNVSLPPSHPSNVKHIHTITIDNLYLIMGRELVAVSSVPAGFIFAIKGLEGVVGRNATLCALQTMKDVEDDAECLINLASVSMNSAPIVRVALEPVNPSEMEKLVDGLKLLNQADPCVETMVQETGEHVILTAGELHLERCLKDLHDRFAKIEITVSPPIVPFRETALSVPEMNAPKNASLPRGAIETTVQSLVTFRIRAVPLPEEITLFLEENITSIRNLIDDKMSPRALLEATEILPSQTNNQPTLKPSQFWETLESIALKVGDEWAGIADKIWSFGPKRVGANILIDATESSLRRICNPVDSHSESEFNVREFDENLVTAFQLAMQKGPLCAEPIVGMAYFFESINIDTSNPEELKSKWATLNIISAAQEAFKSGLLDWSPRLKLAMYKCDIQATSEVLGKVYAVVSKRRGYIVSEEMKEGTAFFNISAIIPVVESFGFAEDIRTRTSGVASPQLVFKGFEIYNQDPFWVPTTEEELEDLGEKADKENIAKKYMDAVRKRKGMAVERKVIEHAEKQKTMKSR